MRQNLDIEKITADYIAPPLNQDVFLIDSALLLGQRETINLVTGFASLTPDCEGVLNYSICTLEPAIGSYEIEIHGQDISLQNLRTPGLVALANNSEVDYNFDKYLGMLRINM